MNDASDWQLQQPKHSWNEMKSHFLCWLLRVSICPHKVFLIWTKFGLRWRSMSDTQRCAVWPNPTSLSRSWRSEMCENNRFQRLPSPPTCMLSKDWWWIMTLQDNIRIFDIYPHSASYDLQTYGVLPLANEFCLSWGVVAAPIRGLFIC